MSSIISTNTCDFQVLSCEKNSCLPPTNYTCIDDGGKSRALLIVTFTVTLLCWHALLAGGCFGLLPRAVQLLKETLFHSGMMSLFQRNTMGSVTTVKYMRFPNTS